MNSLTCISVLGNKLLRALNQLSLGIQFDLVHLKNFEGLIVQKRVVIVSVRLAMGMRPNQKHNTNLRE